jgi:cytochrome c553
MKIIVAKLDPDDMAAIAAYVASKFPPDPVNSSASTQ